MWLFKHSPCLVSIIPSSRVQGSSIHSQLWEVDPSSRAISLWSRNRYNWLSTKIRKYKNGMRKSISILNLVSSLFLNASNLCSFTCTFSRFQSQWFSVRIVLFRAQRWSNWGFLRSDKYSCDYDLFDWNFSPNENILLQIRYSDFRSEINYLELLQV